MPVWNRAETVGRAIESALAQSFTDFELIIVDDGSTDAIDVAIAPYISSEKIRFLRQAHLGVSAARNKGLQSAAGKFIAYLDSDNLWRKDFLARMNEALSDGQYDGAYCLAKRFKKNRNGNVVHDGIIGREYSFRGLIKSNFIDLNAFVHTKKIADTIGGFDEGLKRLTDWDLIIRIAAWGAILHVPEVLVDYYYRVEKNAISVGEDIIKPNKLIRTRYPAVHEPLTVIHNAVKYIWHNLPDYKYRNHWLTLHKNIVNKDGCRPFCTPSVIQIEPVNTRIGAAGQEKTELTPRQMRFKEFCKIVDGVKDHGMLLVIKDRDGSLLDPDLPEMVHYAAEKGLRTALSTYTPLIDNDKLLKEILISDLSTLTVNIDPFRSCASPESKRKTTPMETLRDLQKTLELKGETRSQTVINLCVTAGKQDRYRAKKMKKYAKHLGVDIFSVMAADNSIHDGNTSHCEELYNKDYFLVNYNHDLENKSYVSIDFREGWGIKARAAKVYGNLLGIAKSISWRVKLLAKIS